MNKRNIRLCLVLSEGMSLQLWDEYGLLNRELALYRELINYGVHTTFVSFGKSSEYKYKNILKEFEIIYNKWGLSNAQYIRFINIFNFYKLSKIDLVKTNQLESINTAVKISRFWKIPLLGRMGYFKSFIAKKIGKSEFSKDIIPLEKKLASNSSQIILTTDQSINKFIKYYPISKNKIILIPNYVDSKIFNYDSSIKKKYDILFIGRFSVEKNLKNLLKALIGLNLQILFIGRGELKTMVDEYKTKYNLNLEIIDMVPNEHLPKYINSSKIYILPSLAEGHPKSLLEAMSCQTPVIGTNVFGIANLLTHNSNGILCDITIESIRNSIKKTINDKAMHDKLAKNARKYILEHFTVQKIAKKEYKVYKNILN
tara:strand:+ start:2407 stop:3519 length:1113 start_codon:yes stop_codon:yes gene_type:complete